MVHGVVRHLAAGVERAADEAVVANDSRGQ